MALGFGYKLLGEPFLASHYAATLSKALREPDSAKRQALPVHGTSFLQGGSGHSPFLGWDGGHVLLFLPHVKTLSLSVILFGKFEATILISDEPQLWRNSPNIVDEDGWIYVTVPQRNIGLGPITLPDYIAHKSGTKLVSSLTELEAMRIDPTKLPKCTE